MISPPPEPSTSHPSCHLDSVEATSACAAPSAPLALPGNDAAHRHVERLVALGDLPGLQYELVGPEGSLLSVAAGIRDVGTGAPMGESTLQMAYSVAKIVTAIAVLQLAERGAMELDAPLMRYFVYDHHGSGVTIRQLFAHTSGVLDPMPVRWFVVRGQPLDREQELRRQLARHPRLRHAPSQRYGYSNLGYWPLENVIESAAGQDYATYVQEYLFSPLSIDEAEARFSTDGPGPVATGHARRFLALTWLLKGMTPAE